MGMGGQRHAPAAFTPGKEPVPIVQEAGWAPGPVWTGVENLAPTGIQTPDCPAHSESLYWLHYPGQYCTHNRSKKNKNYHSTYTLELKSVIQYSEICILMFLKWPFQMTT